MLDWPLETPFEGSNYTTNYLGNLESLNEVFNLKLFNLKGKLKLYLNVRNVRYFAKSMMVIFCSLSPFFMGFQSFVAELKHIFFVGPLRV